METQISLEAQRINKEILEADELGLIDTDEISDKHHTFGQLYHDRAMLFLVISLTYKDKAWKSRQHHDGTMFNDHCFIVGIETPQGQFTYHYHTDYWDLYDVPELEFAPEYDGHTYKDITRLLSLVYGK